MRKETLAVLLSVFSLTIVFLFAQSLFVFAQGTKQAPPVEWTRTYDSGGVSAIQTTSDGGYAIFGGDGPLGWLVKTDTKGIMQWNKTFSKPGYEVRIAAGQQTSDGGYMLAGGIPNTETVGQMNYGDAIMIKTDGSGNKQWEKIYGGSGHQYVFSAQQTNDGGYILAGVWNPSGVNNGDFYLIKTDSAGNVAWSKTFGVTTANECANDVRQTSDDGYILVGERNSFSQSWLDAYIVKTDKNGNAIWEKTFSNLAKGRLYSVRQTSDGGYIVAGDRNQRPETGTGQYNDFWLIKLGSNGNVQWQTGFGEDNQHDSAKSVRQTTDGSFILIGRYGYDVRLIKTDSTGNMIWNRTFTVAGPDESDVIQTADRGYVVLCSAPGTVQGDTADVKLIKIMRANPPIVGCTAEPSNPLVGQIVVFNASATYDLDNDINSYKWDFKDGNITTTSIPVVSHAFSAPGVYNVTLTVTDGEELSSTYAQEVSVKVYTSISLSSSSELMYASSPVTFSGTLSDSQGIGIGNVPVSIYFSRSSSSRFDSLGEVLTDNSGKYEYTWNPSVIGRLAINAEYAGNQTHYGSSNTTNVEVLSNPTSLSIQLSSSASNVGLAVSINGSLISNGIGLSDIPVLLSYSVTGGKTWNEISQPATAFDGSYSAIWMPSATAEYIVKATWAGNVTIQGATAFVDFAVVPFDTENVFSVSSNSTVSSLLFESENRELSFVVSGSEGTTGYVAITIGKSLIANIQETEIKLNGTEIDYATSTSEDTWLLCFTYPHSANSINVRFSAGSSLPFAVPVEGLLLIFAGGIVVVVCVGVVMYLRRRKGERHYGVNREDGTVTFSDGDNGQVPP